MQALGPVCLRLVPLSPSVVVSLATRVCRGYMRTLLGEGQGRQVWAHPRWPQSEMAKAAFCAHPSAGIRPSRCHGDRASPWPRSGLLLPELPVGRL